MSTPGSSTTKTPVPGTQCQGQALIRSGKKEVTLERCTHPAKIAMTYKIDLDLPGQPQSTWSSEKSFNLCFRCARAIRKMKSTKVIRERTISDG